MKTTNAWTITEHLCKTSSDGFSNTIKWNSESTNGSVWLLLPDEIWISILSNLSHKDLSNAAQVCQRFRYIANDNSLWKLINITNCHSLNNDCLANIGLHQPESLTLYRCHDDAQKITEGGFEKLFQNCKDSLTELKITNCSGPSFEGDTILFNSSKYCNKLTAVDISWTSASDKGVIALVDSSANLKSLSVNGCKITDCAITSLVKKHAKSLVKLEVFGCHALSARCICAVATECTFLENLNIGRVPKITDACLAKIASNLHKLTTLNVTGLNVVRDRPVHYIVKQCPKLENLTLSSCCQVTDVSLVEISTYLQSIKYLDVSGCKKVTDIGIQALARSCRQICYLDLSSTGTGKRGVCLLASYCYNSLECLKLSFCKDVTADAIEKLCKNCKSLKVLHLYGCRVSSDLAIIKKFSEKFKIFHDLSIPNKNILGE
ncbi:F-box/LRR-repeat protein 7-like [Spea bombifrons]|uniref:F-box/LRR-repeat protein 7-like n=1 Tax=Spea bombifrons TaxID=233779 RepID=UPI00234AB4A2|nr:F-box/LRR-repeat protein 7-like [Spea bombifrons]